MSYRIDKFPGGITTVCLDDDFDIKGWNPVYRFDYYSEAGNHISREISHLSACSKAPVGAGQVRIIVYRDLWGFLIPVKWYRRVKIPQE